MITSQCLQKVYITTFKIMWMGVQHGSHLDKDKVRCRCRIGQVLTNDSMCVGLHINSLPNYNILDQSKFKSLTDKKEIMRLISWNLSCGELKTLREKKKMLVTSIFLISHNVFKRFLSKVGTVWLRVNGKIELGMKQLLCQRQTFSGSIEHLTKQSTRKSLWNHCEKSITCW